MLLDLRALGVSQLEVHQRSGESVVSSVTKRRAKLRMKKVENKDNRHESCG
jgi:hypothetical protein